MVAEIKAEYFEVDDDDGAALAGVLVVEMLSVLLRGMRT